jgi:hypothetical protein
MYSSVRTVEKEIGSFGQMAESPMKRKTFMKTSLAVVVGAVCVLAVACHASDLTRAEAKRIVQKTMDEKPLTTITFGSGQHMMELAEEMKRVHFSEATDRVFSWKDAKPCLPDSSDMRLVTGQFVMCPKPIPDEVTWQTPGLLIPLKSPIKRIVLEVTGIANGDNQSERIVEHTWQCDFTSFPKEVQDILIKLSACPRKDKAMLRLYDDGWRITGGMVTGGPHTAVVTPLPSPKQSPSTAFNLLEVVNKIVVTNPCIEIVSANNNSQTITLRNKETKQVITATAEDIKSGTPHFCDKK